jgi:hypothetical protein
MFTITAAEDLTVAVMILMAAEVRAAGVVSIAVMNAAGTMFVMSIWFWLLQSFQCRSGG